MIGGKSKAPEVKGDIGDINGDPNPKGDRSLGIESSSEFESHQHASKLEFQQYASIQFSRENSLIPV